MKNIDKYFIKIVYSQEKKNQFNIIPNLEELRMVTKSLGTSSIKGKIHNELVRPNWIQFFFPSALPSIIPFKGKKSAKVL